jgi:hypothetical protein
MIAEVVRLVHGVPGMKLTGQCTIVDDLACVSRQDHFVLEFDRIIP